MNFPRYRSFPPTLSFVDGLAAWLLSGADSDPLKLARSLVLLPSRRACRSLREAFLRQTDGKPMLLPRIMPIGEVDTEADIFALSGAEENLLPAMPDKRRLMMLTRLIMQGRNTPPARSYHLAVELARLLDETTRHGISFERLHDLVPLELAAHWQQTTEFLTLITRLWPRILAEEGKADNATLTRERMLSLAAQWRETPPDFPVIAAGSTGSIPATSALLQSIAHMPEGLVILPGLDREISDTAWELLEPTHPQYGLKKLLEEAGVTRKNVQVIGPEKPNNTIRAIFAPARLTAHWREEELPLENDLRHLAFMQADTQNDEARMIAYKLREALDTPGKTAALVTPDRTLARMVAAQCGRYGIAIDDSAGAPLADSPTAIFMRLLLEVTESGAAPHALLALLRHPFAAIGEHPAATREYSRLLEKTFLRGVRLSAGMDALVEEIKTETMPTDFTIFITRLRDALRPLEMLFLRSDACGLAEFIQAHCAVAEALATTHEKPGAEILWDKESGTQLAGLLADWRDEAETLGHITPNDYPPLFEAFLGGETVRKPYGTHPRLHILSPIEARLMHYDLVILGEMNEGTWPASISPDPWMSAPMRETFGLPSHAAQIGQSAHDVWMMLHANEVLLTRARKIFGAPQEPSRWWVRLSTLLAGKDNNLHTKLDISDTMQATIQTQDAPHAIAPHQRPEPIPPLAARPRNFSPSSIDLWCTEPYAFYAQRILHLKVLNPLDQEPDNREFGELIHSALEHFSAEFPGELPEHSYQLLLAHGQREFQPYMQRPTVATLWWPRFEAIARHWLAREHIMRKQKYTTQSEVSAKWEFDIADEHITFNARADRVDVTAEGFRLIDYKTGTPPAKKRVEEGDAKQLPLTALALMRSGAIASTPTALIYWALKTREQSKDFVEVTAASELLAHTEEQLFAMIHESLTEPTSYAPEIVSNLPDFHDDYEQLIRRSEWGTN